VWEESSNCATDSSSFGSLVSVVACLWYSVKSTDLRLMLQVGRPSLNSVALLISGSTLFMEKAAIRCWISGFSEASSATSKAVWTDWTCREAPCSAWISDHTTLHDWCRGEQEEVSSPHKLSG
jgi:hypothetical protein